MGWVTTMTKRKTKMSDSEVLKHYTPGERIPATSETGADTERPVLVRRLLGQSRASKPEFKRAKLAVDRVMTDRKSAVIPKKGRT